MNLRKQLSSYITLNNYVEALRSNILLDSNKVYLEDSIKDGLSSLNVYGKVIQSNIPGGYIQLEYIQSTGTQYIDTGIKGNGTTKVDIKFKYHTVSSATGSGRVFGSRTTSSSNAFAIGTSSGIVSATGNKAFWCYDAQPFFVIDEIFDLDIWKTVIFSATEHTLDGISYGDDYNVVEFETPQNLKLFGFDNGGTMGIGYVDIAYCKIWDNGVLIRDLVPVKNSSNVIGMYDTVNGRFFTNAGTGNFIAGPEIVPTPTNPIDIYCSNGKLTISPNEANYISDNVTLGYWLRNNNGQPESSPANFYTNMMPVKPDTNYVCYGRRKDNSTISGYNRFAWYDATGTWIRNSTYTQGTIGSDVSPSNAAYVRFHCNIDGSNVTQELVDSYNWTVREGTIEEPFIPFGIITEGTPEKLNIKGNNLYDVTKDVNDKYIDANGNIGDDTSLRACYSDLIPVKSGEMYTYSGICKSSSGTSNAKRIHGYIDGIWNQQIQILNIDINKTFSNTFTIPANINGIRISHWKDDENTQVEECYRPTKYNNYIDMNLDVANLLSVGDYTDSQDILNGSIIRNVGVKVLDGTENWQLATATNLVQFYTSSTQGVIANNVSLVSTIAPYGCVVANRTQYDFGCYSGGSGNLCFQMKGSATLTSVSAWTQYLADQYANRTPVIIIYPLADAVEETVESRDVFITSGTNTIERNSEYVSSGNMTVGYKKLK